MDATMNGGMQGQGGMVQCPCCGQGQVPPEVAEKVMDALEPQPDTDDTASKLAEAMAPVRKG